MGLKRDINTIVGEHVSLRTGDSDETYADFVQDEDGVGIERYNRDRFLSSHGDMYHNSDYTISASQLADDDWILHLMEKYWFDANTFIPAYFEAVRRTGKKTVTIRVKY